MRRKIDGICRRPRDARMPDRLRRMHNHTVQTITDFFVSNTWQLFNPFPHPRHLPPRHNPPTKNPADKTLSLAHSSRRPLPFFRLFASRRNCTRAAKLRPEPGQFRNTAVAFVTCTAPLPPTHPSPFTPIRHRRAARLRRRPRDRLRPNGASAKRR